MLELTTIQKAAIYILPVLFAITVHEVAHGYIASKLGDPTAKMLGRLTINPIKHIDPVGTILVPCILFFLGGFIFGWAKPVPVTWQNLKNPKRDMALVAVAGPMANLLMALLWALIAKLSGLFPSNMQNVAILVLLMGQAGVLINIVLMVLNLLPIPPLDGSRVITSLVSPRIAYRFYQIEPYGFFVLVLLMITGILMKIISPPIIILYRFIASIFGL